MNLIKLFVRLVESGTSTGRFYSAMNSTLKRLNGEYTMLHYPMEGAQNDTFYKSQANLTDYCISLLGELEQKTLLEIGCGNGVQLKYIHEKAKPAFAYGIDLNRENIQIANDQLKIRKIENMRFMVDDAQKLEHIPSDSIDVVLSIESAFHYPDKEAFMEQVYRVLKPGGKFLVADLVTTKRTKGTGIRKLWKRKMVLHHWSFDRYMEYFNNSRLKLQGSINITDRVVRGFKNYKQWIRESKSSGWLRESLYTVFYTINVAWIRYLFRKRRQYLVFVGTSPVG